MVGQGASDLLLVSGLPPSVRIRGEVVRQFGSALASSEIEDIVFAELPPLP